MLWNRTTKYRKTNRIDIGLALGTIFGAFFGLTFGIIVFANLILGLFVSLFLIASLGAMIGVILDWLQISREKSTKRMVNISKVNTRLQTTS